VDSLGVSIGREDRWERFRHARMDAFRCGMWMQDRNASALFFLAVVRRAAVNERQPSQNSQERCYTSIRLGALDEENTSCQ
jgi:hypothetical protein